jgi:hypothetical protein
MNALRLLWLAPNVGPCVRLGRFERIVACLRWDAFTVRLGSALVGQPGERDCPVLDENGNGEGAPFGSSERPYVGILGYRSGRPTAVRASAPRAAVFAMAKQASRECRARCSRLVPLRLLVGYTGAPAARAKREAVDRVTMRALPGKASVLMADPPTRHGSA